MTTRVETARRTISASAWLPAEWDALRETRDELAADLDAAGWSEAETFRVLVCADEALGNALTHGSVSAGRIGVAYSISPTHAEVAVLDEGGAGECVPSLLPAATDDGEHGRGLVLMHGLADRVGIWGQGTGTLVALEFCTTESETST